MEGVPRLSDVLTVKDEWPAMERLLQSDPGLVETVANDWVKAELEAIDRLAHAMWRGRREYRSSASSRMWQLSIEAERLGYRSVAEALQIARLRVW